VSAGAQPHLPAAGDRNAVAPGTPLPAPPRDAAGPFGFADPSRAREVFRAAGLGEIELSALGAQVGSPLPRLEWHGRIEQHLRHSGLPAVVLQANLFMSNLLASPDAIVGGTLPAPAGDGKVSYTGPADVAAVAAAVLIEGRSLSEPW
jgi:uncharacterized protein YbjT (DUF2867 family)